MDSFFAGCITHHLYLSWVGEVVRIAAAGRGHVGSRHRKSIARVLGHVARRIVIESAEPVLRGGRDAQTLIVGLAAHRAGLRPVCPRVSGPAPPRSLFSHFALYSP